MKLLGKSKLLIVTASTVGVVAVGGAVASQTILASVKQTETELTVEAGDELNVSVEDCFKTSKFNYKNISFDTSAVDTKEVGEYDIKAAYKDNEYTIKVKVQDTKAPEVELTERHVYLSDLKDLSSIRYNVYDATEVTLAIAGMEKKAELDGITEETIAELEKAIVTPCDQEALANMTSVVDEEGVYSAALKFEDAHGNVHYEEIIVIYDKAEEEVPEEIPDDTSSDTPKEDKSEASNSSSSSSTSKPSNDSSSSANNNSSSSSSKPSGNTSSGANSGSNSSSSSSESKLNPQQQQLVNAGYYKIIPDGSGGYVVMVKGGESQYGHQLIEQYLDSIGKEAHGGWGQWLSSDNNQYMVGVEGKDIVDKIDPDDPESWDDFWG